MSVASAASNPSACTARAASPWTGSRDAARFVPGPGSGYDVPPEVLATPHRLVLRSAARACADTWPPHRAFLVAESTFPSWWHAFPPSGEPALGAARSSPSDDPTSPVPTVTGPWLDTDGPSGNARRLLASIADAGAHGLDPERYDLRGLHEGIAALFDVAPPRRMPRSEHAARAALSYRFDRAFTRLVADLGRGVVDGRTVQRRLYRDVPAPDVDALRAALERGELDVDAALGSVSVGAEGYLRLTEAMRTLLAERAAGRARNRVGGSELLRVGMHHRDVMQVKRRLLRTGDLPPGTVLTPMFDADFLLAVRRFQTRHGLAPDGQVGAGTRAALDRTLEDDMDDLALSLERWRWMPRELGERHLFVNLPDYRLHLRNGTQRVVDMAVVIGATEHPTPSFSQPLSYLEFNPTWTVPRSIAREELLPIERRRPGYLASRGFDFMKVVDGRLEKVPYESVTPEELEREPFPYMLRQRGGDGNALGRMKFMMPNPYAIYLHDTPAKRHFAMRKRAHSHGCIRLSDPDRLADLLMRIDGQSADAVAGALAEPTTHRVHLRSPVPTHLAYFTAWIDRDGTLQRRADVYEHDPALRAALAAHDALPSVWLARSRRGNVPPG